MNNYDLRHELKFIISDIDAAMLKKQLSLLCEKDPNSCAEDYSYDIRSLYFDDVFDTGYYDKINGVEFRKKYRIRIYNKDPDFIKLECKHKLDNMTYKQDTKITQTLAKHLINKEYSKVHSEDELVNQFLIDARLFGLKPSVIVDYRRLAFTYPVSNVRITFDENICTGKGNYNMFLKTLPTYPVYLDPFVELEVKCSEFIPVQIASVIASIDKCRAAISKYALAYNTKY